MNTIELVKKIFTSQFELDLFSASLASLNDVNNKLRYNNFAYSIRELSRHFLHALAPESKIKNCVWYTPETIDNRPTRAQRIKYAIQGGISDDILQSWDFDIDNLTETIKSIKNTIDSLSKYTHINENVFNLDDDSIKVKSNEVLAMFARFVMNIDEYRENLKQSLDGQIEDQMISSVFSNSFENIDSLAPRYSLNYCDIYAYHISEINDSEIIVNVSGELYVTLEYGSNKERREGDGLDLKESFPFETKVRYEISEDFPNSCYEIDDYGVDTSKWYGEEDYL
ncbi:hypothetical protein QT327_06990 [Olivibacter sp. 47]|uniref:pPIWI-associating nuclease domain-containing protein n=1 Tax=Olivibacter sp. 47 TaxID=3056486 RepID=UPI0025A46127|nr:hypothetical protein [Olivibacter sp. 47]MDM8174101.1 hypothetical protein [Olivibacter sp. 47]